jgi:ribosome biogenesis protein BRX1
MGFSVADGKIWVRTYQISEVEPSKGKSSDGDEAETAVTTNDGTNGLNLVEIGPRFCLTPSKLLLNLSFWPLWPVSGGQMLLRRESRLPSTFRNFIEEESLILCLVVIQEGSFGGPIIYENKSFVSPNQVRSDLRKSKASKHNARTEQYVDRLARKGDLGLRTSGGRKAPVDALDSRQLLA